MGEQAFGLLIAAILVVTNWYSRHTEYRKGYSDGWVESKCNSESTFPEKYPRRHSR